MAGLPDIPHPVVQAFALAMDVVFLAGVALVLFLPCTAVLILRLANPGNSPVYLALCNNDESQGGDEGRWVDLFYLIGFLAMGIGIIADILLVNALEENQQLYILSFLMLVFVLIQATLLIRDWIIWQGEGEALTELEELNRSLEKQGPRKNQGTD